jgi:hypothetical protein
MPNVAPRTARRKRRPLTAHRWFPAMIALWFAALFGLCALAVPLELLERLVGALGIERVIPAAAPPLGETARLLIAGGLSSVGEIVGLLLGRALGARHRPKPSQSEVTSEPREEPALADAPRKPLSAPEDLVGWDDSPEPIVEAREVASADEELPTAADQPATPNIVSAPLESLGVVQLSERLALAMRARREPPKAAPPEVAQALEAARASLRRASGAS